MSLLNNNNKKDKKKNQQQRNAPGFPSPKGKTNQKLFQRIPNSQVALSVVLNSC